MLIRVGAKRQDAVGDLAKIVTITLHMLLEGILRVDFIEKIDYLIDA
jgi:hypothetical protein